MCVQTCGEVPHNLNISREKTFAFFEVFGVNSENFTFVNF